MKRFLGNSSPSISEQAADWLVELAEQPNGADSRRQFMNWLKKSPQHIEEFLAVASLQQEVSEQTSAVADIVADLKSMANVSAVPLFGTPMASLPVKTVHRRRSRYLPWAGAASLALMALIVLELPDVAPSVVSHATGLGEQRSVVLDDGSIVTLNTLSEATVRFDSSMRQVTLVAGEAMFDVVSDPERLFVVETGTMSLNVLGTKFSVYRKNDSTRVAVVEGSVRAISRHTSDSPIVVRAGEGAVATAQGISLADPRFDVGKAIAWTERRLIFDGAPLTEVVREFNRYNRKPLIVEDKALANRAITTVVNAHDVSALVGFLELEPDVEVAYGDDSIRIRVRH
jgi:transmembrane sensor